MPQYRARTKGFGCIRQVCLSSVQAQYLQSRIGAQGTISGYLRALVEEDMKNNPEESHAAHQSVLAKTEVLRAYLL